MSSKWLEKAKNELNELIGKMAYRDYKATNYKGNKKRSVKHIPYALSQDTMEVKKIYGLIYNKNEVSKEVEEQVKAFLLPYRRGIKTI